MIAACFADLGLMSHWKGAGRFCRAGWKANMSGSITLPSAVVALVMSKPQMNRARAMSFESG